MKYLNSLKVGAREVISCKRSCLVARISFSVPAPEINVSTKGEISLSILSIKVLQLALLTGYTGNNGGCGNLSSRYSSITAALYKPSSLSTRIGRQCSGLIERTSSGASSLVVSFISQATSFSASTIRTLWL